MMQLDFDTLRPANDDCPSDRILDALRLDALPAEQTTTLRQHIDGCALCAPRMAEIERGFDAFPQLDERVILAAARSAQSARPWWVRWMPVFGLAAAAAIAVIWVLPGTPNGIGPAPGTSGVRIKGKARLQVFKQTAEGSAPVESGSRLKAGTRFKFGLDMPSKGAVRIIGLDANGPYTVWKGQPALGKQVLPGAHTLDDAPGDERLFVVHCPGQAEAPQCPTNGETLVCPASCTVSKFVIRR